MFGARSAAVLRSELSQDDLELLDEFVNLATDGGMPTLTAEVLSEFGVDPDGWLAAASRDGIYAVSFQQGSGGVDEFVERFPVDPEYAGEFDVEDWHLYRLTRTLSVGSLDGRIWLFRAMGAVGERTTLLPLLTYPDPFLPTPDLSIDFEDEPNVVVLVQSYRWIRSQEFQPGLWDCLAPTLAFGLTGDNVDVLAYGHRSVRRLDDVFPESRGLESDSLEFGNGAALVMRLAFEPAPLFNAFTTCATSGAWEFGEKLHDDLFEKAAAGVVSSLLASAGGEFRLAVQDEDTVASSLSYTDASEFFPGLNGLMDGDAECTAEGCTSEIPGVGLWLEESSFWLRTAEVPRTERRERRRGRSAAANAEEAVVLRFAVDTDADFLDLSWIEAVIGRGRIEASFARSGDHLAGRVELPSQWTIAPLNNAILRVLPATALDNLVQISAGAGARWRSSGSFPESAAAAPPNNARECDVDPEWAVSTAWSQPSWEELDFAEPEENLYFYQFDSHPGQFTASAFGDLDCDGVYSTFVRFGTVSGQDIEESAGFYIVNQLE